MTFEESDQLQPGDVLIYTHTHQSRNSYWIVSKIPPKHTGHVLHIRCVYDPDGNWTDKDWAVINPSGLILHIKAQP